MPYWYIRSVLTDNSRFSKLDLLHLIPMLVYTIAAIPYLFAPLSYKTDIAARIAADPEYLAEINFTILSDIFSKPFVYLSRPVLILGYLIWSFGMFIHFVINKNNLHIIKSQHFITKWLSVLFGFTFILFVSYIFLSFLLILIVSHLFPVFETFAEGSDVFFTTNVLQVLSALGLTGLLVSALFFPEVLYGLPRIPDKIAKKG